MKYSIEGEGPNIGRRTAFFDYSKDTKALEIISGCHAIYCRTEIMNTELLLFLKMYRQTKVYIETSNPKFPLKDATWSLILNTKKIYNISLIGQFEIIKIEVESEDKMEASIIVADTYIQKFGEVWLMPTFDITGEQFMKYMNYINPKVRYMPPVQNLLHIP